jgi:hypothetical protein
MGRGNSQNGKSNLTTTSFYPRPIILGMLVPLNFPYTKDLLVPIIIICFEKN